MSTSAAAVPRASFILAAFGAVTCAELAAGFGPSEPIFSLAPQASCDFKASCYQGTEHALEVVAKLDAQVCKDSLLRQGGCALYAFPERAGVVPYLPQVKLFEASPGPHLWFRAGGTQCGEVDAAPRMPPSLFAPANTAALQLYTQVTLDGWSREGALALGRCSDGGYTQYQGVLTGVDWGGNILADTCKSKCSCTYGDNCKDVPDNPPFKFCSLCGR
jgi:hypothetical protein